VWDAVVGAEFATVKIGSEQSGKVTRYAATATLLDRLDRHRGVKPMRLLTEKRLGRNTRARTPTTDALVYLHSGTKDLATGERLPPHLRNQPLPLPANPVAVGYFGGLEDSIDRINRNNLRHSWEAFRTDPATGKQRAFQPNVMLQLRYVGRPFRCGRLWTRGEFSAQSLPKKMRKGILIDGQPVAELDYSGMLPRMLYHMARIDPKGDVYRPEVIFPRFHAIPRSAAERKVVRGVVKRVMMICLNVGSQPRANSSVGRLLAEHPHEVPHGSWTAGMRCKL
jgi:hypothetical protein